jgi:miniconductance mechanosensitive channel
MQGPNIVPESNIVLEQKIEPGMKISPRNDDLIPETPNDLFHTIRDWLSIQDSPDEKLSYFTSLGIVLGVTFVAAFVVHLIAHRVLVTVIRRIAKRTKTQWDDYLVEQKLFTRIAHLAPASVIYFSSKLYPDAWQNPVQRVAMCYMIIVSMLGCVSFLNALVDIYGTLKIAKTNPIKGFVGGAKLFVVLIGCIFLLATMLGLDPWGLVTGIGAVTAVLLLVFKDSILGLVASIQIITNDLVNIGDWVEIPKYGADGDVLDISLTTIKVQNWDKTITTIPTYALIADSFKNWRGMSQWGGRRIKRSISIDMDSVGFLSDEMIRRFEKFDLLDDYIRARQKEVGEYNQTHCIDTSEVINGRRLTNLGTFRAYLKEYLKRHQKLHQNMTLLVRHLAPTPTGIPIEIYAFTSDIAWANYEDIQADIFDHILSVIPEFNLRVFQNPTGSDIRAFLPKTIS